MIWYYQLGFETINGERFYGVYEAYLDSDTQTIINITKDPIQLIGDTKREILDMLTLVKNDINKYPEIDVNNYFSSKKDKTVAIDTPKEYTNSTKTNYASDTDEDEVYYEAVENERLAVDEFINHLHYRTTDKGEY